MKHPVVAAGGETGAWRKHCPATFVYTYVYIMHLSLFDVAAKLCKLSHRPPTRINLNQNLFNKKKNFLKLLYSALPRVSHLATFIFEYMHSTLVICGKNEMYKLV